LPPTTVWASSSTVAGLFLAVSNTIRPSATSEVPASSFLVPCTAVRTSLSGPPPIAMPNMPLPLMFVAEIVAPASLPAPPDCGV
jgi:hypothetical protein